MKKHILYSILVSSSILLSSCNSWINVTPQSQIREEQQFSTVEGFQQALVGCYIGMTDGMLYGRVLSWSTIELMAGQFFPLQASFSNDYGMSNYLYESSNSLKYINGIWKKGYNVIANANNAIKYLEINRNIIDNINYSLIKGELLSIRAFMHFDLMRLYGQGNLSTRSDLATRMTIPYVTILSKEMTSQQSYAKTIDFIVNDLKEAIKLLEEDPVTGKHPDSYYSAVNIDGFYSKRQQRFNYYAANLLLANVYMWEGSSQSMGYALDIVKKVITETEKNGLVKWTTSTSVISDMIMKSEHILSLSMQNIIAQTSDYFKINITESSDVKAQFVSNDRIMDVYEVESIGNSDFRFTKQFTPNSHTVDGKNTYTPLKYYGTGDDLATRNYIPIMRIPEAYYIAAECLLKQSEPDLAGAQSMLNTVRRKRGINTDLADLSQEQIMKEIIKEYNKEYYCEGKMFFLYKRLGIQNIPGYNGQADDKTYIIPYPSTEVQMGRKQ